MLRLVESLAIKAERAKTTTVEFFPLREAPSHKCAWCETYAKGNPKGWHSYRGVDRSYPGGSNVGGDVCSAKECRLSIQAKLARVDRQLGTVQALDDFAEPMKRCRR
jgi:hypothetical protein